jgi:hypothetical protein
MVPPFPGLPLELAFGGTMATTVSNIVLYEELKKSLSEDAARMIAEVVPESSEVATKTDIAELKSHIDARLLRFTLMFFVPMWVAMLGLVGVLVAKI